MPGVNTNRQVQRREEWGVLVSSPMGRRMVLMHVI